MDPTIQALADELGIDYGAAEKISYLPRHEQEMAILDAQMGRANALRDTAGPEGRQAGRVYVAANPLEHLAAGFKRYKGGKEAERVEGERQGALTKEEESRQAAALAEIIQRQQLMDAIRGPQAGAQAAPVQGPPVPAGMAPGPAGGGGGGGGAPAPMPAQPMPQPQAQPVPQINPQVDVLRGAQAAPPQGPPQPMGAQAAPVQGPPEPGWFDKNPTRQGMRDRLSGLGATLKALRDFEGFARGGDKAPPQQGPFMGDRAMPNKPYPWPRRG